jgi:hypothetical protein
MAHLPLPPTDRWRLLRLRWPLAGALAVAFATGQVLEATLLGHPDSAAWLAFDVVGWGLLGGAAVWGSLTWAYGQELRHKRGLQRSLEEQRDLNERLRRANEHLALLSETNQRIAASSSLDEILDAALPIARRLVPARVAALVLDDDGGRSPPASPGRPPRGWRRCARRSAPPPPTPICASRPCSATARRAASSCRSTTAWSRSGGSNSIFPQATPPPPTRWRCSA